MINVVGLISVNRTEESVRSVSIKIYYGKTETGRNLRGPKGRTSETRNDKRHDLFFTQFLQPVRKKE